MKHKHPQLNPFSAPPISPRVGIYIIAAPLHLGPNTKEISERESYSPFNIKKTNNVKLNDIQISLM